jgi:hypothetical protein
MVWCSLCACFLAGCLPACLRALQLFACLLLLPPPLLLLLLLLLLITAAADIANAVLDGVDGILLGAETLRGSYPKEAVATIAEICRYFVSSCRHVSV